MTFEPQSIGDFLDDMYDLHMDEHAFGWQYNMLWKLLGLEGMPQLPDTQSFLVGTFPDYYEHVAAARSRFSVAELRQNVHEYRGIIHLQGGMADTFRKAHGLTELTNATRDAVDRHAKQAGVATPKKDLSFSIKDLTPVNWDNVVPRPIPPGAHDAFARSKGVRPGSGAFFDLMMPHTAIDDKPNREFVMALSQLRDVAEPHEQLIYGYQYERLERIIGAPIPGFRRSNVKYRMDSIESIDTILKTARDMFAQVKPTLKVVK